MVSDNELLGLYLVNNDQSAFESLVKRHAPMVMHVCRSFLWNPEDCDDAFQLVFALLSRKGKTLQKHSSIGGWLHKTSVNVSLTKRRSISRKREVTMDREPGSSNLEPWELIANAQQCEKLHLEVSRLPRKYQDVIVLCHFDNLNRSDAADILDTTESAVKATLARARKMLRQRLLQQGIGLSSVLAIAYQYMHGAAACKLDALAESTTQQIMAAKTQPTPAHLKLTQLTNGNMVSTAPIGLVHISLAIALGLVAVGAIGLMGLSVKSSWLPLAESQSVIFMQEIDEPTGDTFVEFQEQDEKPREPSGDSASSGVALFDPSAVAPEQPGESAKLVSRLHEIQLEKWKKVALKVGLVHPNSKQLQNQLVILRQMQLRNLDAESGFETKPYESSEGNETAAPLQEQGTGLQGVIQLRINEAETAYQIATERLDAQHPTVLEKKTELDMWRKFSGIEFDEQASEVPIDEQEAGNFRAIARKARRWKYQVCGAEVAFQLAKQKHGLQHPETRSREAELRSLRHASEGMKDYMARMPRYK